MWSHSQAQPPVDIEDPRSRILGPTGGRYVLKLANLELELLVTSDAGDGCTVALWLYAGDIVRLASVASA